MINLVLFTTVFPYPGGEQFLETEIAYLAKTFGRIYIVPFRKQGEPRPVPSNVTILDDLALINKGSCQRLCHSLMDLNFYQGLSNNYAENRYWIIRFAYIKRIEKLVQNLFSTLNITAKNTLFYSYWFDAATIALARAKQIQPDLIFVTRTHADKSVGQY
jgi:colanic acid/amylovoran biosynthesis glycosyltransferase